MIYIEQNHLESISIIQLHQTPKKQRLAIHFQGQFYQQRRRTRIIETVEMSHRRIRHPSLLSSLLNIFSLLSSISLSFQVIASWFLLKIMTLSFYINFVDTECLALASGCLALCFFKGKFPKPPYQCLAQIHDAQHETGRF